ncbi:MAG TPA: hypothetical protein VFM70_05705 [Salinimicrobium sp.]|nr:hypothetical protein [Salinimicrobium sp.]
MEYEVEILLSSKIQIAKALDYYSKINELLPEKILEQLDLACDYLGKNPYFQKRYKNVRNIPIEIFPYILLFSVDEDRKLVKVISCFQTFQDPKKYPK